MITECLNSRLSHFIPPKYFIVILATLLCALVIYGLVKYRRKLIKENWRWALRERRIRRWFIYKAWQKYLPNLRWLGLLIVSGLTYLAVRKYLPNFDVNKLAELKHPADATVMLAIMGAPVAYVIWLFRDANARLQIENQRKDVNLKDFQRLAEWAAGMHLPENKVISSDKSIKSDSQESNSNAKETVTSTENSVVPTDTFVRTPSRREGAASLQIAAIYQLQAFLQGDYGQYFQRPAFQLLKSIWFALVSRHLVALEEMMLDSQPKFASKIHKEKFERDIREWNLELQATTHSTIGQAIAIVLSSQQGWLLRSNHADLPNAILTGYTGLLEHLHKPLELDGLDLRGIKLEGANLNSAQLQGANLNGARLQGASLFRAKLQDASLKWARLEVADLMEAQLQDADLSMAHLQGANLSMAQLQDANLSMAEMQHADLNIAELQGASLWSTRLEGANLSSSLLQGACFTRVRLQGANLMGIYIDASTRFKDCEIDDETIVLVLDSFECVDVDATVRLREQLHSQGLVLPEWSGRQLHSKPTTYHFRYKKGALIETRHDVGLFSELAQ